MQIICERRSGDCGAMPENPLYSRSAQLLLPEALLKRDLSFGQSQTHSINTPETTHEQTRCSAVRSKTKGSQNH
jgi:hypothetical protein